MTKNLTEGTPFKSILSFTIPILLGNLFQQAYNLIDSAIVGRFVGVEALAGVGSTGSVNFLIIGFVMGTSVGFTIPISKSFGANNYDILRKYYTNALWIVAVVSVFLTIVTLIFIEPILILMQTPDDMFPYAKTYISTIFAGIPGIFLYNYLASVLRSLGDSKTPVFFLICSALMNVVLDLVFVLVFEMGVFGTGLATVISQTTAGVFCILLIRKKFFILKTDKSDWKIDFKLIKTLVSTGFPMGLQMSITAIGSVILQTSINSLGSTYCAAITSAAKISMFACQGCEALGVSLATYTGQNLGAKKLKRIGQGVRQAMIMGLIYVVAIFVFLFFTVNYLALIFVSASETEIIACIRQYILVNSGSYIFLSTLLIFRNTIQGLGYSVFAMLAGVAEMIARILVGIFFVPAFGYTGAVFSNPVAWLFATIFLVPAYLYVIRKVKNEHNSQTMSSL